MFSTYSNTTVFQIASPWAKFCQLFSQRQVVQAVVPGAIDLEIASSLDAFTSLEEMAPGMDWQNLLAATWGLPAVAEH
ncbi:MAG: hypothetical protein HC860_08185 [Alkalinema sp. RU_4_3]|nr:hypothetical protein [Alkalinema sp. RU_4_3]